MRSRLRKALAGSWRRKCTCFCSGIDLSADCADFRRLFIRMRPIWGAGGNLGMVLVLFALSPIAHTQTLTPTLAPSPSASPEEETIVPTFETQKLARTFM